MSPFPPDGRGPSWTAPVWSSDDETVIVKPAGISSEGAPDAALESVRARLGWPAARLPHRLDRLTRGFLLIARDAAAVARHNEAIRAKTWTKGYLARLRPTPELMARAADVGGGFLGPHKAYLRREGRIATVVRSGGDPSFLEILAVAPVPRRPGELHAAIRLLTGRFHQIRAMCADLGAPLAGDRDYGERSASEPTLEHAVFSFPVRGDAGTGQVERVTLWNPQDPARESVAPAVVAALAALAAAPASGMTSETSATT